MLSSVYLFLNIGTGELMLIFFVALLLFGGDKLPGLARSLGRGIRDFKDASEDVKREINQQINTFDEKRERKTVNNRYGDEEPEKIETTTDADEQVIENSENPAVDNNVDTTNVAEGDSNNEQEKSNKPEFVKPANTVEYKS